MGYRHSEEDILEAARAVALDSGLTTLTFRSVGERLGISDRMVVYYFQTKRDLVSAVVSSLVADIMEVLEDAFGAEPLSGAEIQGRAWSAMTSASADRVFALFFEVVGAASAGVEPFDELAVDLLNGWVDWLTPRMEGRTRAQRQRLALAAIARIDGLLLLRHILGPEAANQAARAIAEPS